MKHIILLLILQMVFCIHVNAAPKISPPKVDFKIGARQLIDNQAVSNGAHIFRLYCALDFCDLTLTSFECEPVGISERGFTPKTTSWSSRAGFLEISDKSKGELELTVFQGTHRQLPATIKINYSEESQEYDTSTRVRGFKTEGLINMKTFPQEMKTVNYEPIIGSLHVEDLGCGLIVPGIEK